VSKLVITTEIKDEINKILYNLGADMNILCLIGSLGDTLENDEVLEQLQELNSGNEPKIIWESDDNILFNAEQKTKRNKDSK